MHIDLHYYSNKHNESATDNCYYKWMNDFCMLAP